MTEFFYRRHRRLLPPAILLTTLLALLPAWTHAAEPSLDPYAPAPTSVPPTQVVIVAHNDGTEVTDLMVPYAVLSAAGADVRVATPTAGAVALWPALTIMADVTLAQAGRPDLIVVPAVHDHTDPALLDWLREQARAGTPIASICDGAFLLAEAGLLEGRRATAHFYSHDERVNRYPEVTWVRDARYVVDGPVLTSAGVSASGPAAVYLAARLTGPAAADRVAKRYGIATGVTHHSDAYRIGASEVLTAIGNYVRGLIKEPYVLNVRDGVDEYALAYAADMLARTSRVRVTLAAGEPEVRSRFGLRLQADAGMPAGRQVLLPPHRSIDATPALAIESPDVAVPRLLNHLRQAFGPRTADFVAVQLEMPAP